MTQETESTTLPTTGKFTVVPMRHPQGCCTYLIADGKSHKALALDVHLDFVEEVAERIRAEGWALSFVVDSHTHADHPSGSAALAALFGATRVAHAEGHHAGVQKFPADGEHLALGDQRITVRHAPGHTPDHLVLLTDRELFSGDSLFIGGVARTDFLGGDAGTLHDSLHRILADLEDEMILYPGHDYEGRVRSTIGAERAGNPWLTMERTAFVENLIANPPPRPANMDDLLRLNRSGVEIPAFLSAAEAAKHVVSGGASTVIDVRTGVEYDAEHVPGSRLIPLDRLLERIDEVRATPAPRLLLCRTGSRAEMAQETLGHHNIGGLTVIDGGIEAYVRAGGEVERGRARMSLERQVRVIAGALVLIGAALAWWVHPAFVFLAAFVGVGQIFAGVTDWCGMGLLLAKAPWNRSESESTGGATGACAASAPSACAASAPSACAASAPSACAASAPPQRD
ncbi:MAG: glyoxylase-like metal-dependent hydrolase (beta-lactamase superfamily II) [Planctomycetota bacterium]|jgi:glyoxylase-like metal-dependent hydrolase (beta-lactamase superfamily II)/rhodanese-related sulfurtransferase